MKLVINCPKCLFEGVDRNSVASFHELRDDNIYKFKCSNGHDEVQAVLNEKFELLFEFGAIAL